MSQNGAKPPCPAELVQGLESVAASLDGQMNIRAGLQSDIADINKRILLRGIEVTNAAWQETDLCFTRWQTEAEAMVRNWLPSSKNVGRRAG